MFKRTVSVILVVIMVLGFFPGLEGFLSPAEAASNSSSNLVGGDADVFSALGFDTETLPEGFDEETTDNPYGRDKLTGNEVLEVLYAGSSGYSMYGKGNNGLSYGGINAGASVGKSMPGAPELFAGATGDFDGDGISGEVIYVGVTGLSDSVDTDGKVIAQGAKNKTGAYSVAPLVMYAYDSKSETYSGSSRELGKISPYYTIKSKDSGVDLNPQANAQVKLDDRWQNLLQVTAGDYDGDGISEIAVFIAENTESTGSGSHVDIFKLKRTDSSKEGDWLNMNNWERVWSFPVSVADERVPNMVSLVSGDFNRDGVDDLAMAYGTATYTNGGGGLNEMELVYAAESKATILWGGKSNMLQTPYSLDLGRSNSKLGAQGRVSLIFNDINGDGTPELIMTGQPMSDLQTGRNNYRSMATYVYDSAKGLMIDAAETIAIAEGTWVDLRNDKGEVTGEKAFQSTNGYDEYYFSMPYMKTNSAVVKLENADFTYLYIDSALYKFNEGTFALDAPLDELASGHTGASSVSGGWANKVREVAQLSSMPWIVQYPTNTYSEYNALSGDINGLGHDILSVSFIVGSMERETGINQLTSLPWHYNIVLGSNGGTPETKFNSRGNAVRADIGKPLAVTLPDADYDTTLIEYSGIHYLTYSDPQVLAVIAAAPYFEDVESASSYDYAWQNSTTYSRINGSGHSDIVSVDFSVGGFISAETTVGGVQIEGETSLGFTLNWEKETTKSYEYTLTFETSQDEDAVAFYSIPTENYLYYVYTPDGHGGYTKETSIISNTFSPAYQVLSLRYYESIQGNYDELPQIAGTAVTSTPGDPSSYPSSSSGYKVIAEWNDDPAAVSYGKGAMTQEITITEEEAETYVLGGYWNFKLGGGGKAFSSLVQSGVDILGGVEWSLNPAGGWSNISLEGTSISGTVANMPEQFEGYGYYFSWKLFSYAYSIKGVGTIPIISYIVNDVRTPPSLPQDFKQDYEKSTSSSNYLTWTYEGDASKFFLYKYYDFPVGGGISDPIVINPGDPASYTINKDGVKEYFFIDDNLASYTEYKYAIQVERASPVPPRSAPSAILTARTKASDGYPSLSITESDGEDDGKLLVYPDKTSHLTANVTGPAGQIATHYYSTVQYQWQKLERGTFVDIAGEKSKTLSFASSGVEVIGTYRALVNVQTKEGGINISAFTTSVTLEHSKRKSLIEDLAVSDSVGGGVELYAKVKNAHSDSVSTPGGMVTFTLTSNQTGVPYQFFVELDSSGVANSVIDSELPAGLYTVLAYYSGSYVFKSCTADALYLSQISSGYVIDAPTSMVYGNGGEVVFRESKKSGGVTETTDVEPATATLYEGDRILDSYPGSYWEFSTNAEKIGAVKEGRNYRATDADGVTVYFTASRDGNVKIIGDYAYYVNSGTKEPIVRNEYMKPGSGVGKRELAADLPAGGYVVKMTLADDNVEVYDSFVVNRREIMLQLPTVQLAEKVDVPDALLGDMKVISGAWAECDMSGDVLKDDIAKKIASLTYYNTAGQTFANVSKVTQLCGYYTTSCPTNISLASNYRISFVGGAVIVLGASYELKVGTREYNDLQVGSVRVNWPEYGTVRDELSSSGALKQKHQAGTRVVLTAVPDDGYEVYAWYINGKEQMTKSTSLAHVMLSENTTIEVQFVIKQNTLTFGTAGDAGGGTIACDDTGLESGSIMLANSLLRFTARANPGYHFKEWRYTEQGKGSEYDNEDEGKMLSYFDFTMPNTSCSVIAVFERDFYTLEYNDLNGNDGLAAWYYTVAEDGVTLTQNKLYVTSGSKIKGGTVVTVEPAKGCELDSSAAYQISVVGSDGVADYQKGTFVFTITEDTVVNSKAIRHTYDVTLGLNITAANGSKAKIDATITYQIGNEEYTFNSETNGLETKVLEKVSGGTPITVTVDYPAYYNFNGWTHIGAAFGTSKLTAAADAVNEKQKALATHLGASGADVTAGSVYSYTHESAIYYFIATETGIATWSGADVTINITRQKYTISQLAEATDLTAYLTEKPLYTVTLTDISKTSGSNLGDYLYELPDGAFEDGANIIKVHSGDTFTVSVVPYTGKTVVQWSTTKNGAKVDPMRATSLSFRFPNIIDDYTLEPIFASTTYNTISYPTIKEDINGVKLVADPGYLTSVASGNDFKFRLSGAGVALIDKVYSNENEFTDGTGTIVGETSYSKGSDANGTYYLIKNITTNQVITLSFKEVGLTVNDVDISAFSGAGWSFSPSDQTLSIKKGSLTVSGGGDKLKSFFPSLSMQLGDSTGTVYFRNLTIESTASSVINVTRTQPLSISAIGKNIIRNVSTNANAQLVAANAPNGLTVRGNGAIDFEVKSESSGSIAVINTVFGTLTVTGNVNMSVKSDSSTASANIGVVSAALVVGAAPQSGVTPPSPTLKINAGKSGAAVGLLANYETIVYGGNLLVDSTGYGIGSPTIHNHDGIMEVAGTKRAFYGQTHLWNVYYVNGYQMRTRFTGESAYSTLPKSADNYSIKNVQDELLSWSNWNEFLYHFFGIGNGSGVYNYVQIAPLEAGIPENAAVPLTVRNATDTWTDELNITCDDTDAVTDEVFYYYLTSDETAPIDRVTVLDYSTTFNDLAIEAYGTAPNEPAPGRLDSLEDALDEYIEKITTPLGGLQFVASYHEAADELRLGSGKLSAMDLNLDDIVPSGLGPVPKLENYGDETAWADALVIWLSGFDTTHGDHVFQLSDEHFVMDDPAIYDYTLSGTVVNTETDGSIKSYGPAVDAVSASIKSLTLDGYASSTLKMGKSPLRLTGANYLNGDATKSPLTADSGILNIFGSGTLTLTTGANSTKTAIENAAGGNLALNLTNVSALVAYSQAGYAAVNTNYTVKYCDATSVTSLLGEYGYAWLQDIGTTSSAAAVTQTAPHQLGSSIHDQSNYSYLRLYTASRDAAASINEFYYDLYTASGNQDVTKAAIHFPTTNGVIHYFDLAASNGSCSVKLDGDPLTMDEGLGGDFRWTPEGTPEAYYASLVLDTDTLAKLDPGRHTIIISFYDENTSDSTYYTLEIPLVIVNTEISKGGLTLTHSGGSNDKLGRGKELTLTTAYTGTTPQEYVWTFDTTPASNATLTPIDSTNGASAVLEIAENAAFDDVKITVKSYKIKGDYNTNTSYIGEASVTIEIVPVAASIGISCVNETVSTDGSYMLYHNTADKTAKTWDFNAAVTLDDDKDNPTVYTDNSTKNNGESPIVSWSLTGAIMRGTDLNTATGELTIDPGETGANGQMKLTATYVNEDGSKKSETIVIRLSTDSFVSYDEQLPTALNGHIESVVYGAAQLKVPEAGLWMQKNSTVTATAVPNPDYTVKTWYVNGINVMDNPDYTVDSAAGTLSFTVGEMQRYHITADFINTQSFQVVYSARDRGSVSATSGNGNYVSGAELIKGDSVTLTATPDRYCKVSRWVVDGTTWESPVGTTYTGETLQLNGIEQNHTVAVEFEGVDVNVNVLATEGGEVSIFRNAADMEVQGTDAGNNTLGYSEKVSALDNIEVVARPKAGYQVKSWAVMDSSGNFQEVKNEGVLLRYLVNSIKENIEIRVTFEKVPTFNVTVHATAYQNGEGTVTYGNESVSNVGGSAASKVFEISRYNTATFVAAPAGGSYLYEWTVTHADGTPYAGFVETDGMLTLNSVEEDIIVTAIFRVNFFDVTLKKSEGGTLTAEHAHPVDASARGTLTTAAGDHVSEVKGGSMIEVSILPEAGKVLKALKVKSAAGTETVTPVYDAAAKKLVYTVNALTEPLEISAEFEDITLYTVTAPTQFVDEEQAAAGSATIAPVLDGYNPEDADATDATVDISRGSAAAMTFVAESGYIMDINKLSGGIHKVITESLSKAEFEISIVWNQSEGANDYVVTVSGVDKPLDFSGMENPFIKPQVLPDYDTVNIGTTVNGSLKVYYGGARVENGAQIPTGGTLVVVADPDEYYKVDSFKAGTEDLFDGNLGMPLDANAVAATHVLDGSVAFTASFKASHYKVNIVIFGTGEGTVTVSYGEKSITESGYMEADANLSISADEAVGSSLALLSVANTQMNDKTATHELKGELTIVAVFNAASTQVNFNSPTNGLLNVFNPATNQFIKSGDSVPVGTQLALITSPNTHYGLKSLTGSGVAVKDGTYTVDASKSNYIEATFELAEVEIKWLDPTGGKISVSHGAGPNNGEQIINGTYIPINSSIRVSAAATSSNYSLGSLLLNSRTIGNNTEHIAASDTMITATFNYTGEQPGGGGDTIIIENPTPGSDGVYRLLITVVGNGKVNVVMDGEEIESGEIIDIGSILNITAEPAKGAHLMKLTVNGVEVDNGVKYEVYANTEIKAEFDSVVPYYLNTRNERVFVGFAFDENDNGVWDASDYIVPDGKEVHLVNNAKTFLDMNHWSAEYVDFVTSREIFLGTTSTLFSPDAAMSRAMFATVIGRLYERSYGEIKVTSTRTFTDCDYGDYYAKYVEWAAANGILDGYGDGRFGPHDDITREQMAKIMHNFVEFLKMAPEGAGGGITFSDADDVSGWAREGVAFCQETGLIEGKGNNMFKPGDIATRSEAATIITRLIQYVVTKNAQ